MNEMFLEIDNLKKSYGDKSVLNGLSLSVGAGEFVTVLGASGGGKSTLLRLIAGFEEADGGHIALGGEVIDSLPPD
ncbi:MAG: ATP-binding cassette domain-containing protein, partial [Eubacterium sp.]|nr:ATP-binding cassette domain-containing protein [Eubacterium sp.]